MRKTMQDGEGTHFCLMQPMAQRRRSTKAPYPSFAPRPTTVQLKHLLKWTEVMTSEQLNNCCPWSFHTCAQEYLYFTGIDKSL